MCDVCLCDSVRKSVRVCVSICVGVNVREYGYVSTSVCMCTCDRSFLPASHVASSGGHTPGAICHC